MSLIRCPYCTVNKKRRAEDIINSIRWDIPSVPNTNIHYMCYLYEEPLLYNPRCPICGASSEPQINQHHTIYDHVWLALIFAVGFATIF